jgi:hypothetical protein
MSDEAMILGAVAVLVAAAYARTVGCVPQAVIHRTGATMIGLGGFGLALFLAVLFVMDIMDGRQDEANASTIALGFATATCIALAVWSVLCGFGGAWRARWTVAGVCWASRQVRPGTLTTVCAPWQ